MYLLLLHYKTDLQTVDSYVPDHSKYLQKNYELGNFLLSGRRIPRIGGIIIARAENEDAVRDIRRSFLYPWCCRVRDYSIHRLDDRS